MAARAVCDLAERGALRAAVRKPSVDVVVGFHPFSGQSGRTAPRARRRSPVQPRTRCYWWIFAAGRSGLREAFPGADPRRACPFAGHAYQPMRNLAVAEGLVQDELWAVGRAWFVLCAHEGNPEIMSQWEAWRAAA